MKKRDSLHDSLQAVVSVNVEDLERTTLRKSSIHDHLLAWLGIVVLSVFPTQSNIVAPRIRLGLYNKYKAALHF